MNVSERKTNLSFFYPLHPTILDGRGGLSHLETIGVQEYSTRSGYNPALSPRPMPATGNPATHTDFKWVRDF